MSLYYAGIGSRETPGHILELMKEIAKQLSKVDYTLRSGGADGADHAFASGSSDSHIYLPWKGFNGIQDARLISPENWTYRVGENIHPNWEACRDSVRKLHARNVHQILGDSGDMTRCHFVICWTPGAKLVGGTATAIKLATLNDIPVFNLARGDHRYRLQRFTKCTKDNPVYQ